MTQSFRYWRCDANPTSPHNPKLFTSTTAMIAMSKACDHSPIPPTPPLIHLFLLNASQYVVIGGNGRHNPNPSAVVQSINVSLPSPSNRGDTVLNAGERRRWERGRIHPAAFSASSPRRHRAVTAPTGRKIAQSPYPCAPPVGDLTKRLMIALWVGFSFSSSFSSFYFFYRLDWRAIGGDEWQSCETRMCAWGGGREGFRSV